jgi:hypothetical protein
MTREARRGVRLSERSFQFFFDGKKLDAQQGDTLASALLANGYRLVGRSIKYRRRRGLLSAGAEEPNGLVTVGRVPFQVPNVPGPQLRLMPGMVIKSQNRWPTLGFDLASLLQLAKGFLGAGFYYKTFMWPSWHFYEPMIRRLAGLGPAPGDCNLTPPELRNIDCDVLIAGGGAAGLAAALAATRCGARVVLCERDGACGGELEYEAATIDGQSAMAFGPGHLLRRWVPWNGHSHSSTMIAQASCWWVRLSRISPDRACELDKTRSSSVTTIVCTRRRGGSRPAACLFVR